MTGDPAFADGQALLGQVHGPPKMLERRRVFVLEM